MRGQNKLTERYNFYHLTPYTLYYDCFFYNSFDDKVNRSF